MVTAAPFATTFGTKDPAPMMGDVSVVFKPGRQARRSVCLSERRGYTPVNASRR